jgi:low affinity Fe/Cu permease
MRPTKSSSWFTSFAKITSRATGRPSAFMMAGAVIVVWIVTGPLFHFSDTWQLVINTGTTVITFLMVFLIQESQNHDTRAVQVKLAELIIAVKGAQNEIAVVEDLTERELEALHAAYTKRAHATLQHLQKRKAAQP